jgi:hypothetical protein
MPDEVHNEEYRLIEEIGKMLDALVELTRKYAKPSILKRPPPLTSIGIAEASKKLAHAIKRHTRMLDTISSSTFSSLASMDERLLEAEDVEEVNGHLQEFRTRNVDAAGLETLEVEEEVLETKTKSMAKSCDASGCALTKYMDNFPVSNNEAQRLRVIRRYGLMDLPLPHGLLDDAIEAFFVAWPSLVCSYVNLLDHQHARLTASCIRQADGKIAKLTGPYEKISKTITG